MHDEDLKLIRPIVASGGRKYTAGNIDRSKYDRLVDMGWLTPFRINISDVEYQATDKGRAAVVANDGGQLIGTLAVLDLLLAEAPPQG